MLPPFDESTGNLPPGIHWATWDEVFARFGHTPRRAQLLRGIRAALVALQAAGCQTVYLNGSFVADRDDPADFDACWDEAGVDLDLLDRLEPVLLEFGNKRAAQKAKFGGELFLASDDPTGVGSRFLEFFQQDSRTCRRKGIVAIDLRGDR